MKRAVVLIAFSFPSAVAFGQGMPKTVFKGKQEALYLDQWGSPSRWAVAECTTTSSKERLADTRPTIHMHVPIDHHGGDAKYPVGWPRTWLTAKHAWEKDWTHFEHVEFSVYTTSSRKTLPKTPVTLILSCPDRARQWVHSLTELKLDTWVKFSLPVSKMQHVEGVKTVKFSVSESYYKHGDTVDFYIGGFRFVRSTECKLNGMAITSRAIYEGSPALDVEVDVLGVPKGISRAVPLTIRHGKRVLRLENLPMHRGRYTMAMDISDLKLKPGTYRLVAFDGEKERRRAAEFRVVPSPWKGK